LISTTIDLGKLRLKVLYKSSLIFDKFISMAIIGHFFAFQL